MSEKAFKAKETEWWDHVFDLEPLKGIQVPGMPVEEDKRQRSTPRWFEFFMMTDGVACSFLCKRPKRAAAAPPHTPQSVPFKKDITVVRAMDPGMRDMVTVITPVLIWDSVGEDGMDVDGQEGR